MQQVGVVMQILKQGVEEGNFRAVEDLAQHWGSRLDLDYSEQSAATRESIIRWLLGNNLERFKMLNSIQLEIAQQVIEYHYRILRNQYLGLESERAYRNLMQRLGSLVLRRNKIHTFVALSRERSSAVVNVLQYLQYEFYFSKFQPKTAATCSANWRGLKGLAIAAVIPSWAYRRRSEACTLAVSKMTGMCRVAGLACNLPPFPSKSRQLPECIARYQSPKFVWS